MLFSAGLAIASVVVMLYISYKKGISLYYYTFVADSNKILALIVSVSLFMFFKNIKMSYNRVLNIIASSTFGVLCIHANSDDMRQWLWNDIVDCMGHYDTAYYPLYAIGCVLVIFGVCIIVDQIRMQTIEKWVMNIYSRLSVNTRWLR